MTMESVPGCKNSNGFTQSNAKSVSVPDDRTIGSGNLSLTANLLRTCSTNKGLKLTTLKAVIEYGPSPVVLGK